MTAKEIRKISADKCRSNSGVLALIVLLYTLITALTGSLSSIGGKNKILVASMSLIGALISLFLTGAFMMSFCRISKKLDQNQRVELEDLFSGFKSGYGRSFSLFITVFLYELLWSLLFIIPGIIKSFSYSMSFYIMDDNPNLSESECITKSREIMYGNKWKLFCLLFSYIGWILLCVLTLGILTLWVEPKMQEAQYQFYLSVKK